MSASVGITTEQVIEALRGVLDPELDESIVTLGFVAEVGLAGGEVSIALRLPTFWCAPNFSWLMAEDARDAVQRLPGVERVRVELRDHHAGDQITQGVSRGRSFVEAFSDEATDTLEALRRRFRRKAFFARQDRLFGVLPRERLAALTLGDLPDCPEARAYLAIRAELGLDCSASAPVLTDPTGRPVGDPEAYLRQVRLMRVSMEANTALCRGLLEARYRPGASPAQPDADWLAPGRSLIPLAIATEVRGETPRGIRDDTSPASRKEQ